MRRSASSTDVGRLPSNTRASTWWAGTPVRDHLVAGLPERHRLGLREQVGHQQVLVVADLGGGVDEADEVRGDDVRALVEQLVVGVLAVRARGAPLDRAGVVGHPRPVEPDRLAVRLHVQLLEVGGEARELLAVRQHRVGLEAEARSRTRRRAAPSAPAGSARAAPAGSARPSPGSPRAAPGSRPGRSPPSATARSRSPSSSGRRPSPRSRTCWRGRCRTRGPCPRSWRPRRSGARRRPRRPATASSQARAERALVSVSSVVNVLLATMNSVSAGSRSMVASRRSVPSMLDTNRKRIDRSE